jgi:hypothetical protein
MGKLSALLVGTFLLLVLAYSELASGFTPLINWLGPILGIPLQFLLGLVFMMIGNPLAYPSVLIDWVALGVVIGLIVRRTGGAVLSAFLVYVVGWVFLVATGGIVFYHVFPRGVLSSFSALSAGVSVPPAPPGTDIATILNEPLLNGLPSLFATATSGGGALNSITADWESVLLSWVGNFFILLFIAGLAGSISGKVSSRIRGRIGVRRFRAGYPSYPGTAKTVVAVVVLLILVSPSLTTVSIGASASTDVFAIKATPQSQTLAVSGQTSYEIEIVSSVSNLYPISMSLTGLPSGVHCSVDGISCSTFQIESQTNPFVLNLTSNDLVLPKTYDLELSATSSMAGLGPVSQTLILNVQYETGVKNVVDIIGGFDIHDWTNNACIQQLAGVSEQYCFSIQQNLFLNDPTQNGCVGSYGLVQGCRAYWAQNILVIGNDSSGILYVSHFYEIFSASWSNGAVTTGDKPYLACLPGIGGCGGVLLGQIIGSSAPHKLSLPATLTLVTSVSGNTLTFSSDYDISEYTLPSGSWHISNLTFGTRFFTYAPQLDIVSTPGCQQCKQYAGSKLSFVDFGANFRGSVLSEVQLGSSWTNLGVNQEVLWTISASDTGEKAGYLSYQPCSGLYDFNYEVGMGDLSGDQGVAFTYGSVISPGAPTVSSVCTSTGSGYGNTYVAVYGSGFVGVESVDFGQGNPSTNYNVISDKEIQVFSPPGFGVVDITVTTTFGTSTTSSNDQFTYVTATSFSPASGPPQGGTLITISGNGFTSPARVWFGSTEATNVNVVSSTTITVVSPPGTGTVPIIVEVGPLGNIPILGSNDFTYGTNVSPPFYLESILGEINPDGSATSFYSFLTNSATQSQLFNLTSDEAFMLLFSQSGGLSLLPSSLSSSFSNYASFIPQTMAFLAYAGDCADSQTQANTAARSLGAAIKAPDLNLILSFPLYNIETGTGPGQQGCGFVYGSGTPLSTVGPVVASDVLPSISQKGLINILGDGLTSGHLIPGETPTSVNATVLVVGFGSASALSSSLQFILPYSETSIPSPTGLIGFAGAVTLSQGVIHSSPITHDVSLGQLLDYQRAISFANSSTLSVAGLGVPPPGSSSSSWTDLAPTDQLVLYTNNPSASSSLGSQSSTKLLYSGQSIPASSIHVSFTGLFPANLRVSKSLAKGDNGNVVVSIKVRNLDTSSVTLVSEDDSAFLNSYSGGAILVSGESTNSSSMVLNPNSVITYQYTVHLAGIGSYYSTPATVAYLLNGTSFVAESNAVVWQQAPPPAPVAIFGLLGFIVGLINNDLGTSQSSPVTGSVIVYMPVLLLVGLAVLSEYRSFRNWGRINPETARKLEELKRMLDSGLITEKEYEEQRRRLSTP